MLQNQSQEVKPDFLRVPIRNCHKTGEHLVRQGHLGIDLSQISRAMVEYDDEDKPAKRKEMPPLEVWAQGFKGFTVKSR